MNGVCKEVEREVPDLGLGRGRKKPKPRRLFLYPPQSGSGAEHKGQLPSLGTSDLENSHLCQR